MTIKHKYYDSFNIFQIHVFRGLIKDSQCDTNVLTSKWRKKKKENN